MSIDLSPFIFSWKRSAWDRAECRQKDDDGNPLEVWFFRKKKVILKVFVSYDSEGDWESTWTEIPKKETKKK